jgi:hypothetical protein
MLCALNSNDDAYLRLNITRTNPRSIVLIPSCSANAVAIAARRLAAMFLRAN